MIHVKAFFTTEVQDTGRLARIGNFGLAPVRNLLGGNTVILEKTEVHHVASFHNKGKGYKSKTNDKLHSSNTGLGKTILSIVLIVPGLFLALVKIPSYLFGDVREAHDLTIKHFTPIDIVIGKEEDTIDSLSELKQKLENKWNNPLHQPAGTLTIYGDNLKITEAAKILRFNPQKSDLNSTPMKVILIGAEIVYGNQRNKKDDPKYLQNAELENLAKLVIKTEKKDDFAE
jgi:hypothetical protein